MQQHDKVLEAMGCDDLSTLIDPEFLAEYGLGPAGQYGMVCQDVLANIALLESLGARPFVHDVRQAPNWSEHGIAKDVTTDFALGYSNHQQIELLGPGVNTTMYSDKIPDDGTIALHHVCVFQNDIAGMEKRLNQAGYPTVVSGHIGIGGLYTTRYKYFETRAELGFYLELCEYRLFGLQATPGEKIISGIGSMQKRFAKS
ncbi:MAG: VOC family protein [Pseudomonadales bacterium]